jgi:hypothetical protein
MTTCPACRRLTVSYEFEPLRGVVGRCSVCQHIAPMTMAEGRDMTIIPHAIARDRSDGLCKHGHVLDDENVYISPSRPGVRQCVVCRRAAWRRSSDLRRQRRRRAA